MAVHGVSRSTADVDLLTMDSRVLRLELWAPFEARGLEVRVYRGDADDPLAGTVRITEGAQTVDIIVGRHAWQREAVAAAVSSPVGDFEVPVVRAADLILLKLHAGGPKDAWDVRSLLEASTEPAALRAEVDRAVTRLGKEASGFWTRLQAET
jgi:nucleotidyltransferase AbiEii toxin of type IV toxin-antitoxin system